APPAPPARRGATNVQAGALCRLSKPYIAYWRVGRVLKPTMEPALAIAPSSAFPPILSPMHLSLDPCLCVKKPGDKKTGDDLNSPPYTTKLFLTDGGVHDNLALETARKNHTTVLVTDGGGEMEADPHPAGWAHHSRRVFDLIDKQV